MFGLTKFASFFATAAVLATSITQAAPLDTKTHTHILEPRLDHYGRATWFNVGLGTFRIHNFGIATNVLGIYRPLWRMVQR